MKTSEWILCAVIALLAALCIAYDARYAALQRQHAALQKNHARCIHATCEHHEGPLPWIDYTEESAGESGGVR